MTHKAHCFPFSQKALNKDVISLLDLLLHTRRAMCWCHSTFTVLLFFILKKDLPPLWHASLLQGITFLLNMQDWILQIVQLIQYSISQLFSILITNNFIGEEVTLDENSVCGYKMMGFKTIGEDESKIFSLRLELPIDRNCNVLPLSLDDLFNYTTLMLKFCTNKRIWALLMRQVCF